MNNKFKVGDRVERINGGNSDMCSGDLGTITKVYSNGYEGYVCKDGSNESHYHDFNNLKLIQSTDKIQVGDMVVTFDDNCGLDNDITYGKEYKVIGISNDGKFINFKDDVGDYRTRPISNYSKVNKNNDVKSLDEIKTNEVNKMEIKNMGAENLITAKAKFDEERTNAEVEEALKKIRNATDSIDNYKRQIRAIEEQMVPHQKILDEINASMKKK